jgi:hypothetical protein
MDTDTEYGTLLVRLADTGCLFRIPGPDFYPSRIPDLGSNNSTKRGRGKGKDKYHKNVNNFIFEQAKKFF